MNADDKLSIYAYYADGSIQSWGYDGRWFETYDKLVEDVAKDFADQLQKVTKIRFMFNEDKTKDLLPTIFGSELTDDLIAWLTEIGVYRNGN